MVLSGMELWRNLIDHIPVDIHLFVHFALSRIVSNEYFYTSLLSPRRALDLYLNFHGFEILIF